LTLGTFSLVSFSPDEAQANGEDDEADEYPDLYQYVDCIEVFCAVRVHINRAGSATGRQGVQSGTKP
jgi:hypothetical protein